MSIPTATVDLFRSLWANRFAGSSTSCVISRRTGSSFNDTTGQTEPTTTPIYSGACIIPPTSIREGNYGEDQPAKLVCTVIVPYDEADPQRGDTVTVTDTGDDVLDGQTLLVVGANASTYNTARRLDCEGEQA